MKRVELYIAFCLANGLHCDFRYSSVARFIVVALRACLWSSVESGYLAPLHWFCTMQGAEWLHIPNSNRSGKYFLSRIKQAHRKRYADVKQYKTVISFKRIAKFANVLHLHVLDDLRTCPVHVACFFCMLIAAHSGGLRFCELKDGCRLRDFQFFPHSIVQQVAGRFSAKKIKNYPARSVHHHHYPHLLNAASVIRVFAERFHYTSRPDDIFFFQASWGGTFDRSKPPHRGEWYLRLKHLARAIGLDDRQVRLTTHHGIRAGATVDYLQQGLPKAFVRKQLGWAADSKIFERHYTRFPNSDNFAFQGPALAMAKEASLSARSLDAASSGVTLGMGSLPPFTL